MQANPEPLPTPKNLAYAQLNDVANLFTLRAIKRGKETKATAYFKIIMRLSFSWYRQLRGAAIRELGDRDIQALPAAWVEQELFKRQVLNVPADQEQNLGIQVQLISSPNSFLLEICTAEQKVLLIAKDKMLHIVEPTPLINDLTLKTILDRLPASQRQDTVHLGKEVLQHLSLAALPILLELLPNSFSSIAQLTRQIPAFQDWSVQLKDGCIGVSSYLLNLKSPYFSALFRMQGALHQTKRVDLTQDSDVASFQRYLDVLYGLELNSEELDLEGMLELIKLTHYFNDPSSQQQALNQLHRQLSALIGASLSDSEVLFLIDFQKALKEAQLLDRHTIKWLLEPLKKGIDAYILHTLIRFQQESQEGRARFEQVLTQIPFLKVLGDTWSKIAVGISDSLLSTLPILKEVKTFSLCNLSILSSASTEGGIQNRPPNNFLKDLNRALPNLKTLSFKDCRLPLNFFQDLCLLKNLVHLELNDCLLIPFDESEYLSFRSSLHHSWIADCRHLPLLKKLVLLEIKVENPQFSTRFCAT
ncbi:MAG: hypothetical protein K0S07_991, partial [Chlamydiales bacterium]|nr:hypothetical protein [Chlamydiales bacterium]